MGRHEHPYWLLEAHKGDTVLERTLCSHKAAAVDLQARSERTGTFWWADHRIVPITRSELAHLIAA